MNFQLWGLCFCILTLLVITKLHGCVCYNITRMCSFALILKLLRLTSMMLATETTRVRCLIMRFDNNEKKPYVSKREHLRHMPNMISELVKVGYKLTDEQAVDAVIHSLPNDWVI